MKYAVEMGSGAMICITIFIKTGSSLQTLMGRIHKTTDSMVISLTDFCFKLRKLG
jgi:hypothetical protein